MFRSHTARKQRKVVDLSRYRAKVRLLARRRLYKRLSDNKFEYLQLLYNEAQNDIQNICINLQQQQDLRVQQAVFIQVSAVLRALSLAQQEQLLSEYDRASGDENCLQSYTAKTRFPPYYLDLVDNAAGYFAQSAQGDLQALYAEADDYARNYARHVNNSYNDNDELKAWCSRWVIDRHLSEGYWLQLKDWFGSNAHNVQEIEKAVSWLKCVNLMYDPRIEDDEAALDIILDSVPVEDSVELIRDELWHLQSFWRNVQKTAERMRLH